MQCAFFVKTNSARAGPVAVRHKLRRFGVGIDMSGTFRCPLCERDGDFLEPSKHHLVPKSWDGRVTADICADCHRQIHALFTLPELAREYDTLDKLRAAEPMQRWIKWAGRQGGGRVAVRASHAKKNRSKVKDMSYGAV